SSTGRALSLATALGLIGMGVSGWGQVAMSRPRMKAVRGLLVRVAVSAFTFWLFLRVGAWVADPGGGRAPLRSALTVVLSDKAWIPLGAAALAAAAALITWWGRSRYERRLEVASNRREGAG